MVKACSRFCKEEAILTIWQINLKIDPEGAKVALTADFPSVTIVGNAANQVFPDQEYLDEVHEVKNGYTDLFHNHYGTSVCLTPDNYIIPRLMPYDNANISSQFPFWDETALFSVLDPSNVLNSTSCKLHMVSSY